MKQVIIPWSFLYDDPPVTDHNKNTTKTALETSNPNPYGVSSDLQKQQNQPESNTKPGPQHVSTSSIPTKIQPKPTQKQAKTFAQALTNFCDIPSSQLPQPVLKGDNFAIAIPEDEYNAGMETCKHNLHARIIWPKGSTPLTAFALRTKLSEMWKNLSKWGVMSLGKGFYEFTFTCLEDVKRVRSIASWNLNPGILKLFPWTKHFHSSVQNNSSAQVWLRIYGLSQEYWRPKILFAIASSVGTPICIDSAISKPMVERTFGLFARVLVDIDLSQDLRYKVLVERKDYAFFVDFEYENLPDFCTHCNKIGHYIDICKFVNKPDHNADAEGKKKATKEVRKHYIQTKDGRTKQGSNVADPIAVNDNNDRNINADSVGKGKSPITTHQTDKAGPSNVGAAAELVQNNSFQVLYSEQQDDIITAMKDADKQLEAEINLQLQAGNLVDNEQTSRKENDDDSSQCSEFVEASNQVINENFVDRNEVNSDTIENTPEAINLQELERQNKAFLEKSWANIADNEAAENRLINDLESSSQDNMDGFQVITKSKHRNIKKNTSVKSSYATRGKTAHVKPFR